MSENIDRLLIAKLLLNPIRTVFYFLEDQGGTVNYSKIQCLFVPKKTIPLANYIAFISCGGLRAMLQSKQLRHIFQPSKKLLTLVANNRSRISSADLYPKLISYVSEQEKKRNPKFWKDISRKLSDLCKKETVELEDILPMKNEDAKSSAYIPRLHEGNMDRKKLLDQEKEVESDIEYFTSLLLYPIEAFLWHLKESKDGIKRPDLNKTLVNQKYCPIKLENRDFLILSQLGGIDSIITSGHLNPLILFDGNSTTIKLKHILERDSLTILRRCLLECVKERRASLKPDAWKSICNYLKKISVKDSSFSKLCDQNESAKINASDTVVRNPNRMLELDSTLNTFGSSGLLPLCSLANQSFSHFHHSTSILLRDLLLEPLQALLIYCSFLQSSMSIGEIDRFFKIILESNILRNSTGTALHVMGGIVGISSATSLQHLFDKLKNDDLQIKFPLQAVFHGNLSKDVLQYVEEIVFKIPTEDLLRIKKPLFTNLMDELAFTKPDTLQDYIRKSNAQWKMVCMLLPTLRTLSHEFSKNPCLSMENIKSLFHKEVLEDNAEVSTVILQLVEKMGGIVNFLSSEEFTSLFKVFEAKETLTNKRRLLFTTFVSVYRFANNALLQNPGLIDDLNNIPKNYFTDEKFFYHEKVDKPHVTNKVAAVEAEHDLTPDKTKAMSLKLSNLLKAEKKETQTPNIPLKKARHLQVKSGKTDLYPVKHVNLLIMRASVKGIKSPQQILSFLNDYFLIKMEKSSINRHLENLEKAGLITDSYPRKLTPMGEGFLRHPNEQDPFKMSELKYLALSHELQKKREEDIYNAYYEKKIEPKRRNLVYNLQKKIQTSLSNKLALPVQVHTLGSFKTGLMTKHSDVDLVVTSKKPLIKSYNLILKLIRKEYQKIIPIRYARAPVIKFSTSEGLRCDLTFDSMLAERNSCLIKTYLDIDERVKVFVSTIKSWASLRMIDKSYFNLPSSYTWCIMALFYVQQLSPPLLPNLQAKNIENSHRLRDSGGESVNCWFETRTEIFKRKAKLNKSSVNDLLLGFFHYYGSSKSDSFNWNRDAVDISYNNPIQKENVKHAIQSRMMVIDPFLKNRNLTSVLSSASKKLVQYEMERAYRILSDYNATIDSLMDPSVQ